jgi:hypothetical protein
MREQLEKNMEAAICSLILRFGDCSQEEEKQLFKADFDRKPNCQTK